MKEFENWSMKKIPYLEKVIKINLNKINLIMKYVRKNSLNGKLKYSWTHYKSWGKGANKHYVSQKQRIKTSKSYIQHIS